MTINWKDAAVEAAYDAWAKCDGGATTAWLAALTAAAEAQGLTAPTPVEERRWVSMMPVIVDGQCHAIGVASDGTAWMSSTEEECGWTQMAPPPAPEATP
jgi:hypothetical protein